MFDGTEIDAKFEGKLTCAFKNVMRNLANLAHLTKLVLRIIVLKVYVNFQENCRVRQFSSMFSTLS